MFGFLRRRDKEDQGNDFIENDFIVPVEKIKKPAAKKRTPKKENVDVTDNKTE